MQIDEDEKRYAHIGRQLYMTGSENFENFWAEFKPECGSSWRFLIESITIEVK